MKFMTMVFSREKQDAGPPPPALFGAIAKLGEDAAKAGVFVEMGGLMPTVAGSLVGLRGGEISVTDGPFAEAREVIGGYAVYETRTKEEAIEWARRFLAIHQQFWPGWEGEVEVRQIMDQPPPM